MFIAPALFLLTSCFIKGMLYNSGSFFGQALIKLSFDVFSMALFPAAVWS